ncbi:MAG: UvrD-helicase domain-containing protein, partial [Clostridia bacterium]|nr:UvrD-helicase domain-containing protein [Clostridia bacterium]
LKQSIYRFRQAEPTIFINKYRQYKDMISTNNVIELKSKPSEA